MAKIHNQVRKSEPARDRAVTDRAESKGEVLDASADPRCPAAEAMAAPRGAVVPEGRGDPTAGMRAYEVQTGGLHS
jgi:hypothetical protein